ncbi:MAG: phosphoglycerate kinase [Patescibacteria group bacterium]
MSNIKYIDEVEVKNKRVLLRVDFNVSLNQNNTIADDARIRQSLPTIKKLLANGNSIIIVSHLGRPKGIDKKYSLSVVAGKLEEYFPDEKIVLYEKTSDIKTSNEKFMILENIRFFPEEKGYSEDFAKELSSLADVYVNDAFGVCHRADTSVIGPPKYIPAYGGLLLKKEIEMISRVTENAQKPVTAIIGGAKVSTKIGLINKLLSIVDYLVVGGGLANTFLCAQGLNVGQSFCEYEAVQQAKSIIEMAKTSRAKLILPVDGAVAKTKDDKSYDLIKVEEIPVDMSIFDNGPESSARIARLIALSKTIIWNGPVGYFENPAFRRGTDFIYYSITQNTDSVSIVGGGDTLAAISKKEYLDKITHISTGGGAMLEYIEKGTLPGIEALKNR